MPFIAFRHYFVSLLSVRRAFLEPNWHLKLIMDSYVRDCIIGPK